MRRKKQEGGGEGRDKNVKRGWGRVNAEDMFLVGQESGVNLICTDYSISIVENFFPNMLTSSFQNPKYNKQLCIRYVYN